MIISIIDFYGLDRLNVKHYKLEEMLLMTSLKILQKQIKHILMLN